jgi:hypothetical protein
MKVFEYAKANGMTNDEVKEKFGLKSHLSVIPEEQFAETVAIDPVAVVEIESKQEKPADVSLQLIRDSIRGAGTKSPYWYLKHLIGK